MRVWIDVLTPKQILFLTPLARLLEERGHEVYTTTRNYREVTELSRLKTLSMEFVGEHGGGSLYRKLRNSAQRVVRLARSVSTKGVEKAVSFSSVEAARVAFGLSIPHCCISDSPHAEAVSKLTVPLSRLLFTPWVVPKRAWTRYGIRKSDIVQYKALDPLVWVKSFTPDAHFKEKLGLKGKEPVVTVRPPEEYAAYLLNSREKSATAKIVDTLVRSRLNLQIVVLPRYHEQVAFFKRRFKRNARVLEHGVDGANLLASTDFFIGAGGTMTAEAVLLGTPAISCFPSHPTYVDRFLETRGLIRHVLNPKAILKHVRSYLEDEELVTEFRKKAARLREEMRSPLPLIAETIEAVS